MAEPLDEAPAPVSLRQATGFWLKLGLISFGGPAGQISIMHQELVERRRWISEKRFLHALNYCMVLPGPEAQQLATYIGWLMHRTWGGLIAGGLFVLPSLVLLIALSWVYLAFGHVPLVAGLFYGIKPAVIAIVFQAVHRIGGRTLKNPILWGIAVAAFVAIFVLHVPFPLIVLGAAIAGFIGGKLSPDAFTSGGGHGAEEKSYGRALIDDDTPTPPHACFSGKRVLTIAAIGGAIVGRAHGRADLRSGWITPALTNGSIFLKSGLADLWRGLRGSALRLSGRGDAIWLGDGTANDRWSGPW